MATVVVTAGGLTRNVAVHGSESEERRLQGTVQVLLGVGRQGEGGGGGAARGAGDELGMEGVGVLGRFFLRLRCCCCCCSGGGRVFSVFQTVVIPVFFRLTVIVLSSLP